MVGSYANVCIYRWPRNMTSMKPLRSFCPWCQNAIAWYDNIPILSFVTLRRRCRHCRARIAWRYPLIEFSMAALWLITILAFKKDLFLIPLLILMFVIVVSTATDLEWKIIPDQTTFLLTFVGLLASPINPFFSGELWIQKIGAALLGWATGWGVLLLIAVVGKKIFGKEAMGMGDAKLLGAFGTVFGWEGVLLIMAVASFIGAFFSIIGLLTGLLKRSQYIPFGPFLNMGCLVILFASPGRLPALSNLL